MDERARDGDALQFAAGELARHARAAIAPGRPRPSIAATRASASVRAAEQRERQRDVLRDRQVGQHVERLEHEADRARGGTRQRVVVESRPARLPSTTIVPASARSRPAIRLSSVDLPTPDSPRIATSSPRATSSDTSIEHGARARSREGLRDVARRIKGERRQPEAVAPDGGAATRRGIMLRRNTGLGASPLEIALIQIHDWLQERPVSIRHVRAPSARARRLAPQRYADGRTSDDTVTLYIVRRRAATAREPSAAARRHGRSRPLPRGHARRAIAVAVAEVARERASSKEPAQQRGHRRFLDS